MNKLKILISPEFNPKIKSFIISDGQSKILLARQFTEITKNELQNLHTQFLLEIFSHKNTSNNLPQEELNNEANSLTFFTKENNDFQYLPYQIEDTKRIYFLLITEKNFNIIQGKEILKTLSSFINSIIVQENHTNNKTCKEIIRDKAFDIVLAADDIINPILGNEGISQAKIQENLKMHSFEESFYNKQKEEKINKAHDELVKGMEEIEKQKYKSNYKTNAVSNEDIEKERREAEEKQKIMDEIEEQRERFARMVNFHNAMRGMNLRRNFEGRPRHENIGDFINNCENLVQAMMIRRLQEIQRAREEEEEDQELEQENQGPFGNNIRLIVTPLHVFYSNNLGSSINFRVGFNG